MKPTVPILLYHHVSPEKEMTPVRFEDQMRWVHAQGYQSLTIEELVSAMRGSTPMPQKAIVITFDDGYLNNWLFAFPILKRLGLKATMYLVTDRIDTDSFLSWEQVKAMKESGLVSFGSHTRSHRGFVRKTPYDNLHRELQSSKETIESQIQAPCRHLAWPWGDYESEWLPMVAEAGYESCATTRGGANTRGSNPFKLRRINVHHPNIPWLAARLRWHTSALKASLFGFFYGWDRRFKVWKNSESPYSHG